MPNRAVFQWAGLLTVSAVLVAVLTGAHLPAALLLGPMVAGIAVSSAGAALCVPGRCYVAAQAVLGCLIARSLPVSALGGLLRDWPLLLAGILSVIAASGALGWLLTRWRVLPGTVAIWGSSPGAAMAMTLMAEAYGADVRLVAFMQYLRVACVVMVGSLVVRVWGAGPGIVIEEPAWFSAVAWGPFAGTLALAALGFFAGRLRIPAGPMLVPLALGVILQGEGWLAIELPPWLLAASYCVIGWSIGLRFTRPILCHAMRALVPVIGSIAALFAVCAVFALSLVVFAGVDPLTAYLATSPGGADSVAIIAASSPVDLPFVVGLQTARFLLVLLTGPIIARFIAHRMGASAAHKIGLDGAQRRS